ncbi:MAG: S9 family peptidase [Bryobacterales bacterium]|nr:S9 family peptidase [Bryobacterales bacterium]
MRLIAATAVILACAVSTVTAQKLPFDINAMMRLKRITEFHLSPDGSQVAYTLQSIDLDNNTKPRQIWTVDLNGGTPRPIATEGAANSRARYSPDGKQIAFLSNRGGAQQIWLMNRDGSGARQLTAIATEADGVVWSPDGKNLVFVSEVYPDCPDEACNKRKIDEEKASKVKARVLTSLLYRHWDQWQGPRRKHLFVVPVEGGAPRDLTPGPRDVPPFSLGGPDDYAISPDGNEVCFAMNADPDQATSTNSDLYVVPITGGETRKVSDNPAADNSPAYSSDGRYIAYRSQTKPGFESDRWRLMLLDRSTGRSSPLTEGFARSISGFTWSADAKRLFFTAEDRGRQAVHMIPVAGGASRAVVSGSSHIDDPQLSADGKSMVYTEMSGSKPIEIYKANSAGGTPVPLTHVNDQVLSEYHLSPLEEFWVEGAEKAQVHAFVVKPPNFKQTQKYPTLFLIHGGPQGAWGESWSYRWNPQVFAAAGFVVVMPNPRGSTGYGQKFTDEVSTDWGGKAFEDIMAVVEKAERFPYVDADRMAAAGGSYGGYMVNWLLGHSNKFKAFVSHAGVYDLPSMGGETEELWFTKWEFGGMPWENPEVYEKWSPSRAAKEFKTPTLVIHGEQDFRVPFGQGLQLFTALQMQKVPSKLLLYPDEGHWIQKPQNSVLWYRTFIDWITEWTRKPAPPSAPPAQ